MKRSNQRVWCWALGPSYIQTYARKARVPESSFCPAVELVDYFHCRNVAYFQLSNHAAENFRTLEKYDHVMADIHLRDETGKAKELSRLSLQFPNLVAGIIDDLTPVVSIGEGTPQQMQKVAADLKSENPSLKLYAVCYTMHFSLDLSAYLPYIDGVSLWVWSPADLVNLDAHVAEAIRLYRKPLHLGLYLFDYSTIDYSREDIDWPVVAKTLILPMKTLQFQCERARQYLKDGRIEAIHILGSYLRDELKTEQARWLADFCETVK